MRILRKYIAENSNLEGAKIFKREAARGIILDGENILLMYTKKYDDYSFPGGGLEKGESPREGVIREIEEETGARGVEVLSEYGIYDETKPLDKNTKSHPNVIKYDYINMISYFYICSVPKKLGVAKLEEYEKNNGMEVKWINIYDAIEHNKNIIKTKPETMGLYVDRELFMLELVAKELVKKD